MKNLRFFTEKRHGLISLWVTSDETGDYNIWDLREGEITDDVLKAISSAFERGVLFARRDVRQAMAEGVPVITPQDWREEK